MNGPAPRTNQERLLLAPPHNESAPRLAVITLARLTHAVADLAAAIEATLAEWQRKARTEPAQKLPPG